MSHSAQLHLVANILDSQLPAEQGSMTIETHPGMNPVVRLSYHSFCTMFAGHEVEQRPVTLDMYTMSGEMFGVQFSTTGYYGENDVPVKKRVML